MPGLLDYTDPSTSTANPANTGRGLLDAPNDGITYRAAMLPYGEDAQGHPHWALPGLLDGPIQAAKRLFLQGGFWNGPQNPQAASDMRDVLYSIYGGNALEGAGRVAATAGLRTNPTRASIGARLSEKRGLPRVPCATRPSGLQTTPRSRDITREIAVSAPMWCPPTSASKIRSWWTPGAGSGRAYPGGLEPRPRTRSLI
jgi:hypothetical protein